MPTHAESHKQWIRIQRLARAAVRRYHLPSDVVDADAAAYLLEKDMLIDLMKKMGRVMVDMRDALPRSDRKRFETVFDHVMLLAYPFLFAARRIGH